VDFTILADKTFGWVFVVSEIILLYLLFLALHRVVEQRLKKEKSKE
jgi:hypothetical protein